MTKPMVVVLGAGQPFEGTKPSALIKTSGDRHVLDWIIDAFESSLDECDIHFVGGYRIDDIVEEYPDIHFSRNEEWEGSGTVSSLFTAPISTERPVYVCYADTIFESGVVGELTGTADVTAAVDSSWQDRFHDRSADSLARAEKIKLDGTVVTDAGADIAVEAADAEFTGLVRFSPASINRALALWNNRAIEQGANLPTLLRALIATDQRIEGIDIGDRWAELETAEDLSRFVLDTKANTLRRLQSMVQQSDILDQLTFTVADWEADPVEICNEVANAFRGESIIVRSSTYAEDGWDESNAGRFESVLDVDAGDSNAVTAAIDQVIDSYPDDTAHQVLVQPMIDNVDASGVVMTRTLEGNGPYYVLNYDATTASTESVTDGTGEHLRTAIIRRDTVTDGVDAELHPGGIGDLSLDPVLQAVREIEELIAHTSLDVEFAIDQDETVYVFQARPMTLDPGERSVDDSRVFAAVEAARREFLDSQDPPPFICGDRTIYGVMPDWNPAEIIGRRPRKLAASLYRLLIMDETWATQRAEYGYRDVRPQPLMKQFAGQPYVDVRAVFNSFIPASVPDELAERLVNYYLDRLEANPELHDKVEFEIALTCLTFDYDREIEPLLEAGFSKAELEPLREGLAGITRMAIERIDEDSTAIATLSKRYDEIATANLPPLHAAYYYLTDCRRYGTLPFAHLARSAFVATSLLRSLERKEILTHEQRLAFQNSLNTVARRFEHDGARVSQGELDWETFVDQYGHLRPGTYEITSPAYRDATEEYLRPVVERATVPESASGPTAVWDEETKGAIEDELASIGLPVNADAFIEFLVGAIEGREHAKFVFSRNLSAALDEIVTFGDQHGLSRAELSHVPIEDFFDLVLNHPSSDVDAWLENRISDGRRQYATTCAVELPPLLVGDQDFLRFERPAREPNFVTSEAVTTRSIELDGDLEQPLEGTIVLIPQADPGYDWLFGHDIGGLITMYGGSNSHMAVRAAEFSLPAAIGVGEARYDQLRAASVLELNCDGRYIRVVQ